MQLGRLALVYRAALSERLRSHPEMCDWDLRPPAMGTLRIIEHRGPISQKDVAAHLYVHPSEMVAIVDGLERHGLVRRERDESDRRRYNLTITPKGTRVTARFFAVVREVDEQFYAVLSPRERTQFATLVRKLLEHHGPPGVRED